MLMPNVDVESIERLKQNQLLFPENCLPMMGIHPCSINDNYLNDLKVIEAAAVSASSANKSPK
jgi:TatD DNase family protein